MTEIATRLVTATSGQAASLHNRLASITPTEETRSTQRSQPGAPEFSSKTNTSGGSAPCTGNSAGGATTTFGDR